MEQEIYDRPREKLQRRGSAALTLPELLQLIIGSGGAKASGAKLARAVARVLRESHSEGRLLYNKLLAIEGLGPAKACQLMASFELGQRLLSEPLKRSTPKADRTLLNAAREVSVWRGVVALYDGSHGAIGGHFTLSHLITNGSGSAVKHILSEWLRASAYMVVVVIKVPKRMGAPNHHLLAFTDELVRAARYLQLPPPEVWAIGDGEPFRCLGEG